MHARWHSWMMLLMGALACSQQVVAQDAAIQVTVRICEVKESDWQREMAGHNSPAGLRERLQARTLVELTGLVKEEGITMVRKGGKREIVTEWEFDRAKDQAAAKGTRIEFIGTEVELQQEPPKNLGAPRIGITLKHDLAPPQLLTLPYDNKAVGAERGKHTVTSPRYERLHWQGEVLVGVHERIIASFRPAHDADTRMVVFFKGSAGGTLAPGLEVEQTIYRVPEMSMIEWLLQGRPDDAALAEHLQKEVVAGKARIVSSMALSLAPNADSEMQTGTEWWLPTETDQVFDRLYMVPVSFESALEGTRLKVTATGGFQSFHAPRAPLAVQWPTSWLRAKDEHGAHSRALHGWMDWYDRFEQEIVGATLKDSTAPQLVAMMPPADQAWGAERQGRWLDVTMAQLSGDVPRPVPHPSPPETAAADPFGPPDNPFTGWSAQPPTMRSLYLGIALDSKTAHDLLEARKPEQDETLLRDLLARVKRGEARVVTSAFAAHPSGGQTQSSARIHACPTEMPSIPSAWQTERVGTWLEQHEYSMALTQHLAPPARTEWKLARDLPEAVMWQPRFRRISWLSSATALRTPGTHLLSAADVPAVMAATDLPANEVLLLFSHLDSSAAAPDAKEHDLELDALIFETSAKEAAAWEEVKSAEFENFSRQKLEKGSARLCSHVLLRAKSSTSGNLSITEEHQTATAFDPPSSDAPFRMRPTATEPLPAGLQVEASLTDDPDGQIHLSIKLQYSTAKPIEPVLEETLRLSASQNALYPGARHEFEEWTQGISLEVGKYHRLLPPTSTSSDKSTVRSAWVRVRRAK
ncbi:hypothetical protein [Prosthecobacter sp.]|uniref:hypothetical protein n=1 Tax=Prosthecobacter sp. TaxID=1965333 RepID=UPI003782F2A0